MDFDFDRALKMRRFFAAPENFSRNEVVLSEEESRHLRDALRLRRGEIVSVFDGAGNEFLCRIETIERKKVSLSISEKTSPPAFESDLNLTIAQALLKGEKFDFVVQKATELGVKQIVPLETARCDVKIKDEKDVIKKLERWRRIALEAAKQSGRAAVPKIEAPVSLTRFLSENDGERIFFAERGGDSFHQTFREKHEKIEDLIVVVGAEGGWEDAEIESARDAGFRVVTLGGRILRAETAAIATLVLMQHRFGDLR